MTRRAARAKTRLAQSLADLEATRTAAARGDLHAEQAQTIADQVALLATERVCADDQARAEAILLDEATHGRDADDLAGLEQAIWERLDPEGFEAREAKALEDQETRARKKTLVLRTPESPGGATRPRECERPDMPTAGSSCPCGGLEARFARTSTTVVPDLAALRSRCADRRSWSARS